MISSKTYDILKWISLICLPACATLYGTLSKIWGLPYGTEIVTTITAVGTFLGALLQISSAKYHADNDN